MKIKKINLSFLILLICSFSISGAKNTWTINGNVYEVDTMVYKHLVGPGTTFAKYNLPGKPLKVSVLEMDLRNKYVDFETCKGGDKGVSQEQPTSMYSRNDYPGHDMIGATNGDFYFYQNVVENGIPRSGQFKKNECITNPVGRAAFVLTDDRKPYIDRVDFSGTVKFGETTTRLHTVNMQRLEWENTEGNQLNLYTNAYGTETEKCTGGMKVIITPAQGEFFWSANKNIEAVVEAIVPGDGVTPIEAGKAVLWGRGTSETFLKTLSVGDKITLNLTTNLRSQPGLLKDFKELMGGSNNIIMRNGELVDGTDDVHPRTCIGFSKDENIVYFVVIDGRQATSTGVSLTECQGIFLGLGAWHAVNLDGGGSSVMIVNGDVVNTPSDGPVRAVGNGCLLVSNAPIDDEIKMLQFAPRSYALPTGAKIKLGAYGYNQYGVLKTKDLAGVTYSCDEAIGRITSDGYFVAGGNEVGGNITASYNGATVSQPVRIVTAELSMRLNSVIIDKYHPYSLEVYGVNGENKDLVDPNILAWSSSNTESCVVSDGIVSAIANGESVLTGEKGTFSGKISVSVQNPESKIQPIDPNMDVTTWIISQTGGKNITATPLDNGMKLTYTGSSGRGPNIKLTKKIQLWGLPDAIRIRIQAGNAPIKKITISTNNPVSSNVITTYDFTPNVDGETIVELPVSSLVNVSDFASYPITLNYIQFEMGVSTTGTEYTIEIPGIEVVYLNAPAGVEDVVVNKIIPSVFPNPISVGETAYMKIDDCSNARVTVYATSGQLVSQRDCAVNGGLLQLPVQQLHQGIYFIAVTANNVTNTVKLIIK